MNPFTFNFVSSHLDFRLNRFQNTLGKRCQGLRRHTDNAFKEVLSSEDDHKHVSPPKGHTQRWQLSWIGQWIRCGFMFFPLRLLDCSRFFCPEVYNQVSPLTMLWRKCVWLVIGLSRYWIFQRMEPLFHSPLPSHPQLGALQQWLLHKWVMKEWLLRSIQ